MRPLASFSTFSHHLLGRNPKDKQKKRKNPKNTKEKVINVPSLLYGQTGPTFRMLVGRTHLQVKEEKTTLKDSTEKKYENIKNDYEKRDGFFRTLP